MAKERSDTGLLPQLARAFFRHAWQSLYRHLTAFELSSIPFCLDRVYRDTLRAALLAAQRLSHKYILAVTQWNANGAVPPPPQPNAILKPLLAVSFLPLPAERPQSVYTREFAAMLREVDLDAQ